MVKGYFDLVIFDEASQCYVERALPVMLRGNQCAIAGDDKQLPPFDLYNVKVDEEEIRLSRMRLRSKLKASWTWPGPSSGNANSVGITVLPKRSSSISPIMPSTKAA